MQRLKSIFSRKSQQSNQSPMAKSGLEKEFRNLGQSQRLSIANPSSMARARSAQADVREASHELIRSTAASYNTIGRNSIIIIDHFKRNSSRGPQQLSNHSGESTPENHVRQYRQNSVSLKVQMVDNDDRDVRSDNNKRNSRKQVGSTYGSLLISRQMSGLSGKLNQNVLRQINMDMFKNIVTSKRRVILSNSEREQLWLILRDYNRSYKFKDLQKPANHRRLWLKCSGALAQKLANPGYYEGLKRLHNFYPNPAFNQIELDLTRTYPHVIEGEDIDSLLGPLRNVLYSIVVRNPTIGYCQGMNFIAARLLYCMKEEEAFWTMTQIVECYLPLDYYSNMIGVLVDQKVLQHFMRERLPRLCEHLDDHQFSLDLIAFQWIACLFALNLPQQIHFAVWDLFFIKGIVVIIRFALTILSLMEEDILKCERFEDIYFLIDHFCQEKLDTKTLMDRFADRIGMQEIEDLRILKRQEIMEVLKRQLLATKQNHNNLYPRVKFISNFELYHGLSKYYTRIRSQTSYQSLGLAKDTAGDHVHRAIDQFDSDLMSIFDCDPSWPLCLYDFTHKNLCPKYVAFRVQQPLTSFVINNYFFTSDERVKSNQRRIVYIPLDENQMVPELSFSNLMIQRDVHVCTDLSHSNFVPYFKKRFCAQDLTLFQNPNLFFDIDDQLDAMQKMRQFIQSVTEPLSDDIFDAVEKFQKRGSLIALKNEVDRMTQLNRNDQQAIMGEDIMENEFQRALLDEIQEEDSEHYLLRETFKGEIGCGLDQLDPLEDVRLPITPPNKNALPYVDSMTSQSISNLALAVRMTVLEAAVRDTKISRATEAHEQEEETNREEVSLRRESDAITFTNQAKQTIHVQLSDNLSQEEHQSQGVANTRLRRASSEDQGAEPRQLRASSDDHQSSGATEVIQHTCSVVSGNECNETSFFEDWTTPAMMQNLDKAKQEMLLQQMHLLSYVKILDVQKNVSVADDDDDHPDTPSEVIDDEEEHKLVPELSQQISELIPRRSQSLNGDVTSPAKINENQKEEPYFNASPGEDSAQPIVLSPVNDFKSLLGLTGEDPIQLLEQQLHKREGSACAEGRPSIDSALFFNEQTMEDLTDFQEVPNELQINFN